MRDERLLGNCWFGGLLLGFESGQGGVQHSANFVAQRIATSGAVCAAEAKLPGKQELSLNLERGASCDAEKMQKLSC